MCEINYDDDDMWSKIFHTYQIAIVFLTFEN